MNSNYYYFTNVCYTCTPKSGVKLYTITTKIHSNNNMMNIAPSPTICILNLLYEPSDNIAALNA